MAHDHSQETALRQDDEHFTARLDPLVKQQFVTAVTLAERGRRDEARAGFERCLELAAMIGSPLELEQIAALLQEIAWCYGDSGQWDEALRIYGQIERLLTQAPGWQDELPGGLVLALRPGYDPTPALIALSESLAIAYDNRGELEQAREHYRRALEGYQQLGDVPKLASVWHHIAMGHQRREEWELLREAATRMLGYWTEVKGIYGQVWAWQYLAQAHAHTGDLDAAIAVMEEAVKAETRLDHRDLERDRGILAQLRDSRERRGVRGLWRRMRG